MLLIDKSAWNLKSKSILHKSHSRSKSLKKTELQELLLCAYVKTMQNTDN